MKTETMKRDVCYLFDKNTKMKTTEFDIDKIFQISYKIAYTGDLCVITWIVKELSLGKTWKVMIEYCAHAQ